MQFRMSDRALERQFEQDGNARIHRTAVGEWPVRYVEAGQGTDTLLFFIHGAPGSLDDFLDYVRDPELQAVARMVSFDRPGYGYTRFGQGLASMETHARVARDLLAQVSGGERVIVVSHSYGGTVALRMAIDYPGLVDRYVLLAPSAAAEHERMFWFNRPLSSPLLGWAVPRAWRVANVEKMAQTKNLRTMEPVLTAIRDPLIVVHGSADRLVPVEHALFLEGRVPPDALTLQIIPEEDHFLIWESYEMVKELLLAQVAATGDE